MLATAPRATAESRVRREPVLRAVRGRAAQALVARARQREQPAAALPAALRSTRATAASGRRLRPSQARTRRLRRLKPSTAWCRRGWSTGAVQVGGEWFLLDLGARAAHLTQIVLEASGNPGDEPLKYKVEVSDDGNSYALVCTGTGAPTTIIKFVDTPARYIRITQTGADPDANWWSIQELTLTCSPN